MITQNPLSLLPEAAGEENAVQITRSQKSRLNKALAREGYYATFGPDNLYTDWKKDRLIYRLYHSGTRSTIIKLDETEWGHHEQDVSGEGINRKGDTLSHKKTADTPTSSEDSSSRKQSAPVEAKSHPSGMRVGMYVRVPVDLDRVDREFREYYLGRIEDFEEIADMLVVAMKTEAIGEDPVYERRECPRVYAHRCRILPGTTFMHIETREAGIILSACENEFQPGAFYDYYVQVDGEVRRFSEAEIVVSSHRGSPDPREQLYNYEFHHPSFKFPRDRLVESYAELRAATFGVEDLVGSRIMLLAHQAEVVSMVLRDPECRYVLADEVGLGKTVEASVILKGLRRRHPNLRTLIVAPASLVAQWYYELDQKFWLRFATQSYLRIFLNNSSIPGLIISTEALETDEQLAFVLKMQEWSLLIVDEAHHIHKKQRLFEHISDLSEAAERALVLSATPIQRRAEEFLALLKLVDPARYGPRSRSAFRKTVAAQRELMRTVVSILPDLTPEYFDPEYFQEEIAYVTTQLGQDTQLESLVNRVAETAAEHDRGLQAAKDLIAYVCENYRIERRMIRNRRVNLQITLPKRAVDDSNAYAPESAEREVLDNLHDYVDGAISNWAHSRPALAYAQLLLHAGLSSPHALLKLIEWRSQTVQEQPSGQGDDKLDWERLTSPAAPRREPERIQALFRALSPLPDEARQLDELKWYLERWQNRTEMALEMLPYRSDIPPLPHRIARILRQVYQHLTQHSAAKIVMFSGWLETLLLLKEQLRRQWGSEMVAEFHIQIADEELQGEVRRFQSEDKCQILLCDEMGGEGRNFQIADLIIHADLPWTPAFVEQRIGRVDRLGREGTVLSAVAYAEGTLEEDLYRIWQQAFQLFTQSMSGMEIALEEIQDELLEAVGDSSRSGLQLKLEEMVERAQELREQVEEERFYEEEAIDERRREEFQRLSENYRDGRLLRKPVLKWAEQAGLQHSYKAETDTVRYYPKQFNTRMMRNAKFVDIPNMEEALARSHHKNTPWITGTFNRSIAVVREDLVFFAPGSDPWTDAIIDNALEADRGRACAISRASEDVNEEWAGLELFYRFRIDPRPTLALGHDPIHLLRARGYLHMPVYRMLISVKGQILPASHPLYKITQKPFWRYQDKHLGKRDGGAALLSTFKQGLSEDKWHGLLDHLFVVAEEAIAEEFSFTADLAEEAAQAFDQQARGMRAARSWQLQHNAMDQVTAREELAAIETYESISEALVAGLRYPEWWLESACFWLIHPKRS